MDKIFVEYHSIENVHSIFGDQRIHNMFSRDVVRYRLSVNERLHQDRLANVVIFYNREYNLIVELLEDSSKLPQVVTLFS